MKSFPILEASGMIAGKAACEDLCFSGASHAWATGPIRNPHNLAHSAGGSSGGSAAALVAAGDVPMVPGGDRGGWTPSNRCGVDRLKPTREVVPSTSSMPISCSVDHCDPSCASIEDVARLLTMIAGHDGWDSRTIAALNMQATARPFDVSGNPGIHRSSRQDRRSSRRHDAGWPALCRNNFDPPGARIRDERRLTGTDRSKTWQTRFTHDLELVELTRRMHAKKISPVEATKAELDRIGTLDSSLHSFALVTPEAALEQAKQAEAEIGRGDIKSPLHGAPIAVKDLCWTKGVPTAAGMTIYRDFRPDEDATVVKKLRAAGAIILGKLQLTEGAFADHHPDITPPVNPWNAAHWSGASSSGSGVATAAGLCYGSLGSDTGGSIRFPSAANGVTGLKPTWGRSQPLWRLRTCGNFGSYRSDGSQRRRYGRDAWRDRRPGRKGPDR